MSLIDADKLIELIDDDIVSLDMPREGYDVCLCTLKMVKQYIKALPTVEPTKMMCNGEHIKCPAHKDYEQGCADGYAMCLMDFDKAEPIEVRAAYEQKAYNKGYADGIAEPTKHGRWIPSKDGHGCECSECGTAYRWSEADTMRYCKICGARMDEVEE